jgi:short-subunit dehydrogenase
LVLHKENIMEPMNQSRRPLAVVTGASSGIGLALAKQCAANGFDLVIAADRPLEEACHLVRAEGAQVESVQTDLSTLPGVEKLLQAIGQRKVHALLANAGHGLGKAFLEQSFDEVRSVIDTNITGTLYLIQKVGTMMREARNGRILITGSIAGFTPGTFTAVYNGSKAFIDSFSWALRNELKDTGVTVTCLMPGATDTDFFERAGLLDTKLGTGKKDDPADVARVGFEAMMAGEGDVISGWKNKLETAIRLVTPSSVLAEQHRKSAEPGGAMKDALHKPEF